VGIKLGERWIRELPRLQRAFTLIELMIVIAIIAILAAILIPNFLHARAESQTSACESNEQQIATAMEEYAVDNHGAYPGGFGASGLTTPYLSFTPTDPVDNSAYTITNTPGSYGAYQVSDSAKHDPTTTRALVKDGTTANCTGCTGILYDQNAGIVGN
jgi:prepilin-type N-terminal cleavage/methylation domain-containing protein